jgi:two-component system chemotaxis sensor kinase CheA
MLATGDLAALAELETATAMALDEAVATPLLAWLDSKFPQNSTTVVAEAQADPADDPAKLVPSNAPEGRGDRRAVRASEGAEGDAKFGRRAEDAVAGPKSLKVDQTKIDRLMNLIGEMVVSKNALPYLAGRAESVFGVRELSREIKTQYAVINRIAEEMQDAIMQVRMMPVSFVFQRFPRLVRDTSRKLGKEVNLILEGEETEADKNIIESLGDPLVHIVRNSLDHGFEQPEVRRAAGKPAAGTLTIRATQESDRVIIEIIDDGKGIDPVVIKRKAYEKGLIDEAALERMSDQEAVNLVFASGFSTVEVISDLSGRGVGMDVVRTAVEKVNGTVVLESEKGKGTRIRLSLPLSMAVTNVMIVESDGQIFGMPMDCVVETVRVPRSAIRTIKKNLATVLRGRIVPLKSINVLLGLDAQPKANAEDELAVLVVRLGDESVGLLVDEFRETVDIILKPMTGVLAGLSAYSGSALMGDGSVLMVLNVKEIL